MGKYALGTFCQARTLYIGEHLEPAIARDTLGHIFPAALLSIRGEYSGVRSRSILAFYTSASDKNGRQIQCLAF